MKKVVNEMEKTVSFERQKLLAFAQRILPHITSDDILQPQDFPELDQNPEFRYQEGLVIGLETALALFYAFTHNKP